MPDPDSLDTPITVSATPAPDQIAAGVRSIVLVISAVTALAGLVSKHDLAGLIAYVQSSDFITAAGIAIAAGSFVWGQIKTRKRAVQLATMATILPDTIATTK
jgi:hypothetical protein